MVEHLGLIGKDYNDKQQKLQYVDVNNLSTDANAVIEITDFVPSNCIIVRAICTNRYSIVLLPYTELTNQIALVTIFADGFILLKNTSGFSIRIIYLI